VNVVTAEAAAAPAVTETLSMQKALNLALDRALASDERTLVFGEDVGRLGGVFRVTDGLQKKFGEARVFDTPLAEAGIVGIAVGLAINGFRPIPEMQFDGFSYPAVDQIVNQVARMRARSRGVLGMPITIRIPSFGGIRAPEHHGESMEALYAHVPGLKVVSPSTPNDAYQLLRQAIADPDPVIFMEPKSRYWHRGEVAVGEPSSDGYSARVARAGRHATLVTWGAMVSRCLEAAEFAAEDGVELEVLDLRWLKPIDTVGLVDSISRTKRAIVVHEAPMTAGLGGEVSALINELSFAELRAPVARVTGWDVPYPSGALEDDYIPSVDRILSAVQRVLEYRRG
jgi:pyruvate dehydrogenase E1 component beta subunit